MLKKPDGFQMRMGADCGGSGRKRRASSSRNQDQNRSPQIEEQVVVRRKTRYSTLLGLQCGHGTVGGTADEALTVRDFNIDAKNLLEEPVDKYAELRCESCGRDDNDAEMILCDRCDAGFHIYCLRPIVASVPAEDWFCSSCTAPPKIRGKSSSHFSLNFDMFETHYWIRDPFCVANQLVCVQSFQKCKRRLSIFSG